MRASFKEIVGAKGKWSWAFMSCALCLVVYAICFLPVEGTAASAEPPSPFAGDNIVDTQAPDFTLKDADGKAISLASYRGSVVLLNFWATWCPSCREEMPSMNKLVRQFKNRKFAIIEVATDRSSSDVRNYLKKHPSDATVLVDDGLSVSRSLYKVFVLPMSFLIDKKGVIVQKYYGEEDWTNPEIVRKIEGLISK